MAIISFLFLALLSSIYASDLPGWTKPVKLETTAPISYSTGLYLDEKAAKAFVGLALKNAQDDQWFNAGAKAVDADTNIGAFKPFGNGTIFATFSGPQDGKKVFAAFLAVRKAENTPDNCAYNPDSCLEVMFTETENGGETWANPVPVNRGNMSDQVNRYMPSFVYIKETGRLYLFYMISSSPKKIAFVTRSPGSQIFSKETFAALDSDADYITEYAASYTIPKEHVLHLSYNNNDNLMYTKSENGGIDWNFPEKVSELENNVIDIYKSSMNLVSQTKLDPNSLYMIYVRKKFGRLRWSRNNGDKWSSDFMVTTSDTTEVKAAICGNSTVTRIYVLAKEKSSSYGLKLSRYEVASGKVVNEYKAFDALSQLKNPEIACVVDESNPASFNLTSVVSAGNTAGAWISRTTLN